MLRTAALLLLILAVSGCAPPVVKPEAFDPDVLASTPMPAYRMRDDARNERRLDMGTGWMAGVEPDRRLTFVQIRVGDGGFGLVLECVPADDRLVVVPLPDRLTPLDVLADPELRARMERIARGESGVAVVAPIVLSLRQAVAERLLGPPLPEPRQIFGVALNAPSHIRYDARIDGDDEQFSRLSAARARVFLRHPPVVPAGFESEPEVGRSTIVGPYDGIRYPGAVELPAGDGAGNEMVAVSTCLDYEVEVGVVIGRDLTPEFVARASDQEIRAAVAGYLIASETKSRHAQVLSRVRNAFRQQPAEAGPYDPADDELAADSGFWDRDTCALYSWAASYGVDTALGPFLVAAPPDGSFPSFALMTARTYGAERDDAPPKGRVPDVFYVRQASRATEQAGYRDRMIWSLPQVVRSILAPDSVIPFPAGTEPRICRGDVICLGTPGGSVVTAKAGFGKLKDLLFWWDPLDWHDAFFRGDKALYLQDGDRLFHWIEGLGFQEHSVVRRAAAAGP